MEEGVGVIMRKPSKTHLGDCFGWALIHLMEGIFNHIYTLSM